MRMTVRIPFPRSGLRLTLNAGSLPGWVPRRELQIAQQQRRVILVHAAAGRRSKGAKERAPRGAGLVRTIPPQAPALCHRETRQPPCHKMTRGGGSFQGGGEGGVMIEEGGERTTQGGRVVLFFKRGRMPPCATCAPRAFQGVGGHYYVCTALASQMLQARHAMTKGTPHTPAIAPSAITAHAKQTTNASAGRYACGAVTNSGGNAGSNVFAARMKRPSVGPLRLNKA